MCVISESEFRLGFKLCFVPKFYSRYIVSYLKIIVICCTYWGTHVYHSQRMKAKGQLGESFFYVLHAWVPGPNTDRQD